MPIKHHAARRHRIPRARYRILNWPAYEAGLRRRGDVTFWLDEAAIAGWHAPRRTTPGVQPLYSDVAVELVPTLRLVFQLALRQAEASARSVLRLRGLALSVPDQTTLSRRGRGFAGRQSRTARHDRPVHLVLDSTGLQLFGQGGWDAAKHGRARRRWLKLHLAVDPGPGEIVTHVLTDGDAADTTQAPDLLRQVEGRLASVTADGAYDGEPVDRASAARQRHPPPDVVVPPRRCFKSRAGATGRTRPRATARPAHGGEGPHGVAAPDRLRAAKPGRDRGRPIQGPDRAQAARPISSRSAG